MKSQKEKNFVSAVVYVFNNGDSIKSFAGMAYEELKRNFENFEMIFVDDGSTDDSVKVIKDFAEETDLGAVTVIKMSKHQGGEAAMNAGIDLAIGDYVFEFDRTVVDYEKSLIMQTYNKALEGYDVVSATNESYKKASSDLFYKIFNKYADLQNKIQTETFRLVSRRAINKAYSMGKFVKYRKALYANCGLKTANIKYTAVTDSLKSYGNEKDYRFETAFTSLILFTNFAYRVASVLSIIMMVVTVIIAVYTVAMFVTNTAVAGYTTIMLAISGSFFVAFLLFAVVIKYLSVIVQLIFNNKEYTIESVEKL